MNTDDDTTQQDTAHNQDTADTQRTHRSRILLSIATVFIATISLSGAFIEDAILYSHWTQTTGIMPNLIEACTDIHTPDTNNTHDTTSTLTQCVQDGIHARYPTPDAINQQLLRGPHQTVPVSIEDIHQYCQPLGGSPVSMKACVLGLHALRGPDPANTPTPIAVKEVRHVTHP